MPRCIISAIAYSLICSANLSSPAFAWVISAGFEGGVLGTRAQSPNPDAFLDNAGDSTYVDSPVLTGSQAGSVSINQGETGFGLWGGSFGFPSDLGEGDELWFRVNVYYPEGWDFGCGGCTEGMKFMRVATKEADTATGSPGNNEGAQTILLQGGATGGLLNANTEVNTSAFFTNNGPWPYVAARGLGDPIPRDQWQTYEMYFKFSSVENEGIYRVWQDENLIFEDLQTATLRSATSVADLVHLYTYWNNGAPQTQTSYVDDILITNEMPSNTDGFGNPMIGAPAVVPEPTAAVLSVLAAISLLAGKRHPRH